MPFGVKRTPARPIVTNPELGRPGLPSASLLPTSVRTGPVAAESAFAGRYGLTGRLQPTFGLTAAGLYRTAPVVPLGPPGPATNDATLRALARSASSAAPAAQAELDRRRREQVQAMRKQAAAVRAAVEQAVGALFEAGDFAGAQRMARRIGIQDLLGDMWDVLEGE